MGLKKISYLIITSNHESVDDPVSLKYSFKYPTLHWEKRMASRYERKGECDLSLQ